MTASASVASASPTLAPRPMYARTRRAATVASLVTARLGRCDPSPSASSTRCPARPPARSSAGSGRPGRGSPNGTGAGSPPRARPTSGSSARRPTIHRSAGGSGGSSAPSDRTGWSSWAPARSRSRPGATGATWSVPRGPATGGRSRTTASRPTPSRSRRRPRRSRPCPTSSATTPCRAGWPRSGAGRSTTSGAAGASASTSTARSTSSSPATRTRSRPRRRRRSTRAASASRIDEIRAVAADRHAELLIAGRTSSATLAWFERNTASRTRALVEERGLRTRTAGQRPAASVLGALLERDGPGSLGTHLATLADGALIDSRVLLAHRLGADERAWPRAGGPLRLRPAAPRRDRRPVAARPDARRRRRADPGPARRPHPGRPGRAARGPRPWLTAGRWSPCSASDATRPRTSTPSARTRRWRRGSAPRSSATDRSRSPGSWTSRSTTRTAATTARRRPGRAAPATS